MDIPDDWDKQFNILFYEETYEAGYSVLQKNIRILPGAMEIMI